MLKKFLWILELLMWGVAIFSVIFVSMYFYNSNIRKDHTYTVFFKDADGLIKGSPVKILGYQIGYISEIYPVNDEICIRFIITDRKIDMPEKMTATVEFTGMGGSKSLELSVPEQNPNNKNFISVIEPKRIQDYYIYSNQISSTLITMTTDFMEMMDENTTNIIKSFIKEPKTIETMNDALDNINKLESDFLERTNHEND